MKNTERDKIETALLENFPEIVQPLKEKDILNINKYKDGSFGFSYLGIMLYANGCNEKGKSTAYPQGLIYYDGSNIFGIGFFKRNLQERLGHLHIVAPKGKHWLKAVEKFIDKFRALNQFPKTSIYIRHLHESQYREMINAGYEPISVDPWYPVAPSEDETFNHRFIKIKDIINYDQDGYIIVKSLTTDDNRDFRRKTLMAYNRFLNFLARNELKYRIEIYDQDNHKELAKNMIIEHFKTLENAIGSTPQDYFNLIDYIPKKDGDFIKYVGFLIGGGEKIPISLFIGEGIDKKTVALYATFTLRNESSIREKFDPIGYTAISQYTYIRMFDLLNSRGYKNIDLGGSEAEGLNNFKRQLGAREKITFWAVKR
ncbi:hypothetical protein HYZ78_01995 [Candidatus Microgenomates bacterium]|nr:hypothetical protein [Candidatus Microgenomates bacterium]